MERKRYESIIVKSPLEFSSIFSGLCRVNQRKVLTQCSRVKLIQLAVILNRLYCDKPAIVASKMLNTSDSKFLKVRKSIERFLDKKAKLGVEYVVMFENTTLELLRRAFSIPFNQFDDEDNPKDVDKLQYQLLKLITQINESLMKYRIDGGMSNNLAILTYTNSASSYDILHYDKQNEYLYQLTQSILFFKLIEGEAKYTPLLSGFCDMYHIDNWREYVLTVSSVFCLSLKGEGTIPADLHIDEDSLMDRSVMDALSIPWNEEHIPDSAKDEFDKEGNSDYRTFRDKPLFKMPNGDYVVHSRPLITDRLYSGLYFDFMKVDENLTAKHPDIPNLFTSAFIEKTLFGGLMKNCIDSSQFSSFDENELESIVRIKDGELGCPDYLVGSDYSIILFECKDIRINALIKEKRDYKLLERELRNKLVCKNFKLDFENRKHTRVSPKRIGCGQIAGHVADIRNNSFQWYLDCKSDIAVYPVLVVADNRLLADGLTAILQQWYFECLKNEGLDSTLEKPLIVMSPLTLLKYSSLFYNDGFIKYFEEYYKAISYPVDGVLAAINRLISFDDYMAQYPFNLKDMSDELLAELMKGRNTVS